MSQSMSDASLAKAKGTITLRFLSIWPRTLVRCFPAHIKISDCCWQTGNVSNYVGLYGHTQAVQIQTARLHVPKCSKVQTACRESVWKSLRFVEHDTAWKVRFLRWQDSLCHFYIFATTNVSLKRLGESLVWNFWDETKLWERPTLPRTVPILALKWWLPSWTISNHHNMDCLSFSFHLFLHFLVVFFSFLFEWAWFGHVRTWPFSEVRQVMSERCSRSPSHWPAQSAWSSVW